MTHITTYSEKINADSTFYPSSRHPFLHFCKILALSACLPFIFAEYAFRKMAQNISWIQCQRLGVLHRIGRSHYAIFVALIWVFWSFGISCSNEEICYPDLFLKIPQSKSTENSTWLTDLSFFLSNISFSLSNSSPALIAMRINSSGSFVPELIKTQLRKGYGIKHEDPLKVLPSSTSNSSNYFFDWHCL